MSHVAIVLAAGLGTRMRSDTPKVAHLVAGRPIIQWVLDAVRATEPARIMVVVGHGADVTRPLLGEGVETCLQAEQLGTGHAVQVALDALGDLGADSVLVVPGDTPLVTGAVLTTLTEVHRTTSSEMTLLTAHASDPTGYGRIVRDEGGAVRGIVEHRDANAEQRTITEINAGMYVFTGAALTEAVAGLDAANAQGELYLPDVVETSVARGLPVEGVLVDESVVVGVNSQRQLAEAAGLLRKRILRGFMDDGVQVMDPDRVYIDAGCTVEAGAVLYPGVHLEGKVSVGTGAVVGPDVFAVDSTIGDGSRVWYSVLRGADVGSNCEVGPFASLRPGTRLGDGSKAGTFVETKNTALGPGAKVPHLSYMGDAEIGAGANIGAGSITCNYDGYEKHQTIIGEAAFIGSDTMLVAPVTVGDGAVTGAGSAITHDVAPGDLAVERSQQRTVPGYAERRAARYRAKRAEEGR